MITVRFIRATVAGGSQKFVGQTADLDDHEAKILMSMQKAVRAEVTEPEPPKPITTDDFRPKRAKPGK